MQGMVREFTVTEPATAAPPSPPPVTAGADAEAELVDFGFELAGEELAAGSTLAVTNRGDQDHEIVAYRIEGDATIAEVTAALADPTAGPPPIDPAGAGLGLVRPGGAATFVLPREAGRYVLVCFVPDVLGDLGSHLSHGMVREIELR
jgi:hypothetical protein